MSLLREIQTAAVDGASDLESLLRKCRVLATRLKHDEFRNWVQFELDGYPSNAEIPEYRKFHLQCFGHFAGPFQSGLRNAPIPEASIPEPLRKTLTCPEMRAGVASLKELVDSCSDGSLCFQWPANANVMFGDQIFEGMVLMQGWGRMSKGAVVGILSSVRNRILSFALEIEASNADAGEAPPGTTPVPAETVSQIVNNHIYGNVGNIATGHGIQQTATLDIKQGDFGTLAAFLRKQGVDSNDIDALEHAVKSDPSQLTGRPFGKNVSTWLGKMVQKSAEGTLKIATTVVSNVLAAAIKTYYGI